MIGSNKKRKLGTGSKRRNDGSRRLSMETLEDRLALTWLGIPPTSIAIPVAGAVTLNAQNSATGAASIATTEVDYYTFVPATTGSYTLAATTPTSNLDTVLGLFSATGQRLAYNDDVSYPNVTDSRVSITLNAGTRYYMGITNYTSTSRGDYSWSITGPAISTAPVDDSYENNDSLNTAYNLGTITATKTINNLVMADGTDWFRFTTTTTGTSTSKVSIAFQNIQGNLQLALYTGTGTQLLSSTGTTNSESVSLNGLAPGTYYVDVYGAAGATNPNYTLTVTPPVAAPPAAGFQITLSMTGLTSSQPAVFQQAAARWSQVITGDLPSATYNGQTVDDLLIDASAVPIDGVNGILGQSAPDAFRTGTDLPYHGFMEFDTADLASIQQSGLLFGVILHEMGHVLGIGTIWQDKGLLVGYGTNNPIFVGHNATAQYNQIFGTNAAGVPVEAGGGPGTAYSHWRESVLGSELMTGYAGPGTNLPLSKITVGSLADLGYTVNYAAADPYTPSIAGLSTSQQLIAGRSTSLRSGFVNLTIDDGETFNQLVISPSSPASSVESRRSSEFLLTPALPVNANLVDSVMEQAGRATDSTPVHATSVEDHDSVEFDHVWADLGQEWDLSTAYVLA